MILIDTNLLIYVVNHDAPSHQRAKKWLEAAMSGPETVGFSWNALLAFLRISTRPGVFRKPLAVRQAVDLVDGWLDRPVSAILNPGSQHGKLLRQLLISVGTAGNLTSDAHLAALAIEHEAVLCSADSDFSRFAGLKWHNPLT